MSPEELFMQVQLDLPYSTVGATDGVLSKSQSYLHSSLLCRKTVTGAALDASLVLYPVGMAGKTGFPRGHLPLMGLVAGLTYGSDVCSLLVQSFPCMTGTAGDRRLDQFVRLVASSARKLHRGIGRPGYGVFDKRFMAVQTVLATGKKRLVSGQEAVA